MSTVLPASLVGTKSDVPLISSRTKKPITHRPKKGKKFASKDTLLQLVDQINTARDAHIQTKQEAERAKRQAILELQMKHEATKQAKRLKKDSRIKELKDQLSKNKNEAERLQVKTLKTKKSSNKMSSGKERKVTFQLDN